jgi:hypothetical protein
MNTGMRPGRRLGLWSAIIEVFLGTAYIIAGLIWLALGESITSRANSTLRVIPDRFSTYHATVGAAAGHVDGHG